MVRLSEVPHSQGLSFNKNAFTPDGRDMIYVAGNGIYDLNLSTLKSRQLVSGQAVEVLVGPKTRRIFYVMKGSVEVAGLVQTMELETGLVRAVVRLPPKGVLLSVNADETLLAGTAVTDLRAPNFLELLIREQEKFGALDNQRAEADLPNGVPTRYTPYSTMWETAMKKRFDAHTPEEIFTIDVSNGKLRPIMQGTDWLGDAEFSPTDPNLLLYSHEGPPTLTDRVWTIRADGSQKQLIHPRTQTGEVALNEFWSPDGKTIWFELERPLRTNPFLVGYDLNSGKETLLHLSQSEASLHFSQSADGGIFSGGGRNNKTEKNAAKPLSPFRRRVD